MMRIHSHFFDIFLFRPQNEHSNLRYYFKRLLRPVLRPPLALRPKKQVQVEFKDRLGLKS